MHGRVVWEKVESGIAMCSISFGLDPAESDWDQSLKVYWNHKQKVIWIRTSELSHKSYQSDQNSQDFKKKI